jgi:hypothetical protein
LIPNTLQNKENYLFYLQRMWMFVGHIAWLYLFNLQCCRFSSLLNRCITTHFGCGKWGLSHRTLKKESSLCLNTMI